MNTKYKQVIKTIADCSEKIGSIYVQLEEDWKVAKNNMTMTSTKRIGEAIRAKINSEDTKYWYYVDVARYLSIPAE